ncbi:holo-[acyl-carrier-protein] synthase [Geomobilimonas luticola]|uniref:Holo-[acyl-carrier-protein] synthase n=1 Tax=Geomobilimonas luticola TaxID=1114878 RepID=A0ABS5SJ71_9BACT|nr:holo-[acyl-carrier-protein] synthase [Geomobilimonas luticola]MBT0654417.1 holo-[acyl-carrier-protein] synthase [Geomobilimonas luticola]
MIFGNGIDIVAISRFERFVEENNLPLLERLFTLHERDYCAARKRSAQHYALRFAAKEAFLKALGTGLRDGICWHDVEVVNDPLGKPDLRLSGRARELFEKRGLRHIFLSLSHDGDVAAASVILEGE